MMEQRDQPPAVGSNDRLGLREWLFEREQNALAIARDKIGADKDGWLEDADYFRRAYDEVTKVCDMRMVLRMVDDNHRAAAGERRKSWNGDFVVSQVRRVLET